MSIRKNLWILLLIAVLFIACDRQNQVVYSSNVPKEREISKLTPDERKLFCESYKTFALQLLSHESICTYLGIAYSVKTKPDDKVGRAAECLKAKKDCLKEELKPECPYKDIDFNTCHVSVETAERCIEESIKRGNQIYKGFSCDLALDFQSEETLFAHLKSKLYSENSPVCEEVRAKCVGFARQDF